MSALSQRVNSGIGSSSTMDANALACYALESTLELILNGVLMRLALPSAEAGSVVGNNQFQPIRHFNPAGFPPIQFSPAFDQDNLVK